MPRVRRHHGTRKRLRRLQIMRVLEMRVMFMVTFLYAYHKKDLRFVLEISRNENVLKLEVVREQIN
jgi:hypothetical protein